MKYLIIYIRNIPTNVDFLENALADEARLGV